MRAVIVRELIVMVRRLPWTLAMCAHISILAAFVMTWNHGVPLGRSASVYPQAQLLAWIWLAVLLPWAAMRCCATDRGDGLVWVSAAVAVPPSKFIAAKVLAVAGGLSLIVIAGLPLSMMAQQMSAMPAWLPVADTIAAEGLSLFVAAVTVGCILAQRDRLAAYVRATIVTTSVVALVRALIPNYRLDGLVLALVGIGTAMLVGARASRLSTYLSELNG